MDMEIEFEVEWDEQPQNKKPRPSITSLDGPAIIVGYTDEMYSVKTERLQKATSGS